MKSRDLLCFSHSVTAISKLSMEAINELAMAIADPVKKTRKGKRFVIKNIGKGNGYDVLELLDDRIVLTCYVENVGIREKNVGLLKLLGLLAYFKDAYEIKIDSLYGPLTEGLVAAQFMTTYDSDVHKESYQIEALSNSNATLAIELRKLNEVKDNIAEQCKIYKAFCTEVLKKFPKMEISTFVNLGIDTGTTERVLKLVEDET